MWNWYLISGATMVSGALCQVRVHEVSRSIVRGRSICLACIFTRAGSILSVLFPHGSFAMAVKPIPEGFNAVSPYLSVARVAATNGAHT